MIFDMREFRAEVARAQDDGMCIVCRQPALPRCHSDAGRREYWISGTCEQCFDEMFAEDE